MRLWGLPDSTWHELDLLQIRAKRLPAGEFETLARGWVDRVRGLRTRVVVNDRVDVALASGADGVHVGQEDLGVEAVRRISPDGFLVGVSTHDRNELVCAAEGGADYAGLGAFFGSDTKPTARVLDPEAAGVAGPLVGLDLPVLAIGGIEPDGLERAFAVPAVTGVAIGGGFQRANDMGRKIADVKSRLDEIWLDSGRGER